MKRLAKGGETARPAGTTAIIRDLLPEIERMRSEDKASWQVIAAALANQGVTEGVDKKPISALRLTSIVTKLRARAKAEAEGRKGREGRADVAGQAAAPASSEAAPTAAKRSRAQLAPELTQPPPQDGDEPPLSEADIRDAQRAKRAHLFKKD